MRVLVVKLTSMGDVLHVMPALTDLQSNHPEVAVDWMVEDSFTEIPGWHSSVDRVVAVSTRRWRSLRWRNVKEFFAFVRSLRSNSYDVVIDAQGLMKSSLLGRFARLNRGGKRIGLCGNSIKESPAAWFYHREISVARDQHAIDRQRQLFAGAFGYVLHDASPDYGLTVPPAGEVHCNRRTILFLHGTTWASKHLPESHWQELADLAIDDGFQVKLCWGTPSELQRAERIAAARADAEVLPKLSLGQLANELSNVAGVVAVDTGLGHMAAALGVATVSVYGATDAALTGALGNSQRLLQTPYPCSPCLRKECDKLTEQLTTIPCYQALPAAKIWQSLYTMIV